MADEYFRELLQSEQKGGQSKKRKSEASKKTPDCDCVSPCGASVAFDTQGCLKCPHTDCAYYVQNFIETFLHCHNVDIYHAAGMS